LAAARKTAARVRTGVGASGLLPTLRGARARTLRWSAMSASASANRVRHGCVTAKGQSHPLRYAPA
jgi:hypothetical protein